MRASSRAGRSGGTGIAMDGRAFCTLPVGFAAHRLDSARINPTIIKIEQSTYSEGVIDRLVGVAHSVQFL